MSSVSNSDIEKLLSEIESVNESANIKDLISEKDQMNQKKFQKKFWEQKKDIILYGIVEIWNLNYWTNKRKIDPEDFSPGSIFFRQIYLCTNCKGTDTIASNQWGRIAAQNG